MSDLTTGAGPSTDTTQLRRGNGSSSDDDRSWYENQLVGGLLLDPNRIPDAMRLVQPKDLLDLRLRQVYTAQLDLCRSGGDSSMLSVAEQLERRGELSAIGGPSALAEVFDEAATSALVPEHARCVGRHACLRDLRRLHEAAVDNPLDPEIRQQIDSTETRLFEAQRGELTLDDVGFSGDRLRAIRERPQPISPLPNVLDPEPHLHVLSGKPKTGKTTFALMLARAWVAGVRPWPGAGKLPGSRALVISREQTVGRLDQTLCRLAKHSEDGSMDLWTDRISLVARDRELGPTERRLLTLDDDGLALLQSVLLAARDQDDPFGLVVLDSLSRLKPSGIEEMDNDAMSRWLDRIEEIAAPGTYVILIHHAGHTTETNRMEARSAPRGASSIGAVAQALWLLERTSNPNHRRLKVDGNAILPTEITLEVCSGEAEAGTVNYFQPINPLDAFDIDHLLDRSETISTSILAWRVAEKEPEKSGDRPPGAAAKTAAALRTKWERERLIEVFDGPHRAKMMRRRSHAEVERA